MSTRKSLFAFRPLCIARAWALMALPTILGLATASPSGATPMGTQYDVETVNFAGGDIGPVAVDFDGVASAVGSMLIGESVTPLTGTEELIEFSIEPLNPLDDLIDLVPNLLLPSSVWVTNLVWQDALPRIMKEDSFFMWFTIDGVAQPLCDPENPGQCLSTKHPLDATTTVYYPGNPEGPPDLIFNSVDFGGGTFSDFLTYFNKGTEINDLHFGFTTDIVPEPSTSVLLGLALLALTLRARYD